MNREKILALARASLPRYTSYPTAAQFHDGVSAREQRAWLDGIAPADTLSLYVHIPFCRKLCWYCGCHTMIPNHDHRIDRYLARLDTEIDTVAALLPGHGGVVHCHFGGGTPTCVPPADFTALMTRLRQRFRFRDDAEIAVEIDPRTLDDAVLGALVAAGVTRASLGVQDFEPEVQHLINRVQPHDLVAQAVQALRRAGIGELSFDLLYGLPGQTVETVTRTAKLAAGLAPQRLSVFGYAHVPWFKKHQRAIDEATLPDAAGRMAQAAAIGETLLGEGYVAIGFDHFARPDDSLARAAASGRLRRNFQGYTDDPGSWLLGFGASAISSLPGGYVQNATRLPDYGAAIDDGGLAGARGVAVDREDRLRAAAIETLLCSFRLDIADLCHRHGFAADALDDALPGLVALADDGLLHLDGRSLSVSEAGRPFVRHAARCLDRVSDTRPGRHSRAL